jgi:hypothetical protein
MAENQTVKLWRRVVDFIENSTAFEQKAPPELRVKKIQRPRKTFATYG